jgi:hypothetical protein
MRVKVIMPFKDKYKKVVYQKGQDIEVTQERYEELTSAASGPFVEPVDGDKEPEEKPEKKPKAKVTKAKK